MSDINDFIGKDIHDLCLTTDGFRRGKVAALKVGVSVKMIARFCNADEPVDGFESLVRLGVFVMNSKWRRVCDEDIERAAVVDFV